MSQENQDRGDEFEATVDAEPEANTSAEPETPETEEPGVDAPARNDKGQFIPRERFNEAVGKERAKREETERELAKYKQQDKVKEQSQDIGQAQQWIKEAIRRKNNMLADGELEKASEIDEQILAVQDAIAEKKAELKAESAKASTKAEIQYDAIVDRLESEYPQINPESDDFDDEAVSEIRALVVGYQRELHMSPGKALERAVKRVLGQAGAVKSGKEDAGFRRKTDAVEKNIGAAKRQPPSTKDVGLDHDKKGGGLDSKTVMKMSYKEFSDLNEDVLAKLRGDTL